MKASTKAIVRRIVISAVTVTFLCVGPVLASRYTFTICVIATNYKGDPPAEADLGIHFSNKIPGKAYIEPEGTPTATTVGQWDRFEESIENTSVYSNPYKDVTLNVVYTRPDGSKAESCGFYDGSKTWKIRFMPDVTGLWRYEASFSDGQPGKSGQFRCVESGIPGMISTDEENPIWFGFKAGAHILIRSFHVGDRFFAENFPDCQRSAFLDWAQQQGYNMLSVASHYLNRNVEGRGNRWQTPDLWDSDSRQPKASDYRKMESILDNLSDRRMMIFPFAGFFGRDSNYPKRPSDQSLYIQYTLARIGPYWNILLNVAGPEPLGGREKFLVNDIDRLGSEIARLNVFGHPLTVHNKTGDDCFGNKPYVSYVTLQGPKTTDLSKLSDGLLRNHHRSKPLYAQETLWANNKYHPKYSCDDIRKNAYVILLSGATLNFAENNGDSSSGFSGTLDLTDRNQLLHDIVKMVCDFFESVPFYKMTPGQDLVDNGFCLAEPGRQYLVYLPLGGIVNISLCRGPYSVAWINAQNPCETYDTGRTNDGRNLAAPPHGDDWLLYLTKADLPHTQN